MSAMGMLGAGDRYTSLTVSRGRFCISSEHPSFMALSLQFLKLLARRTVYIIMMIPRSRAPRCEQLMTVVTGVRSL